jgi:mannose-6-phosphate isomerase-like protein (cupin superfamily)
MTSYLPQLNDAVAELITRQPIFNLADTLKKDLHHTSEPFVWSTIDLESISSPLPESIKSCWMFVLKKDVRSGCHFHPNSIQHMVVVEGEGTSKIGSVSSRMKRFGQTDGSLDDTWCVIPEGVPHEFFPTTSDMVVISFHTCTSEELKEISCDSGAAREYGNHS